MYSCIQPLFINGLHYFTLYLVHSGFKEIVTESLQGPHCKTECLVGRKGFTKELTLKLGIEACTGVCQTSGKGTADKGNNKSKVTEP